MYTGLPQKMVKQRRGEQLDVLAARFAEANQVCAGSSPDALWLSCSTETNEYVVKRCFIKRAPDGSPLLDAKGRRQIREGGFEPDTDSAMTLKEYSDLYDFCISNCILVYESQVYLQKIGIPMGLEVSVFVAQEWASSAELEFITQLIAAKEIRLLQCFCGPGYGLTGRYIDDVIVYGRGTRYIEQFSYRGVQSNSPFPPFRPLNGIHDGDGTDLQLNAEQEMSVANPQIHFLDVKLRYHANPGSMSFETFDKRENLKFSLSRMTRFTPMKSMLWEGAKLGAVQSETSRMVSTNSSKDKFVSKMAQGLIEMYSRGMVWAEVENKCIAGLRTHAPDFKIQGGIEKTFNEVMRASLGVWTNGHPALDHRWLVRGQRRGPEEPHVPPPVRYRPEE